MPALGGRPGRTGRVARLLTTGLASLVAVHLAAVLFTAGFQYRGYSHDVKALQVDLPVMVLMALLILRIAVRHGGVSRDVFARHAGVIIFSSVLIVYLANGRTLGGRDTVPARYLPISILRELDFDLDEFPFLYRQEMPVYLRAIGGRVVSDYPVGAALLALPLYVLPALGGVEVRRPFFSELEKVSAAAIVALSAVVLYFVLVRLTSAPLALLFTGVYAFGTSSLSVSSQGLWQHGPSQLALAAALYCLVRARSEPRWAAYAGFPLAFAVIARPTDAVVAIPIAVYLFHRHRDRALGFLCSGLPPVLFQLWYNATYFGDPFRTQIPVTDPTFWGSPLAEGLAGILLSPARGLFIYSPVCVASLVGLAVAWRRGGDLLLRCLAPGVLLTLGLYAKWGTWFAGSTYGPRYLADLSPVFAVALCPLAGLLGRKRAARAIFGVLVAWSIGAHAIGAFAGDIEWTADVKLDRFPDHAWSWRDNQLVNPTTRALSRLHIALGGVPTSLTAPDRLGASYSSELPRTFTAEPGQTLVFPFRARNEGGAVWLASRTREAGVVHLVSRWQPGGGETGTRAREVLRNDVYPGQSHQFWVAVRSPSRPGRYALEVGLVRWGDAASPQVELAAMRFDARVGLGPE